MNKEKIGIYLFKKREENGKLLKECARDLGIDETYLSRLENGKHRIPVKRVIDFLKVYEITSDNEIKIFLDLYFESEFGELWIFYRRLY